MACFLPALQRPSCDEFLKFCFENFKIAIWTSRTRTNFDSVLCDTGIYTEITKNCLFTWAHTAIFPHSYHGRHRSDNCLGTGGSIRVYLEKLVEADHVQEFVRQNPFVGGQEAITENSREWGHYHREKLEKLS